MTKKLTNERIAEICDEYAQNAEFLTSLCRAIEREIAEQAGQVVPDDVVLDAERFRWIEENCRTEGGGHGFTVFVPVDHEDIGCGIDVAIQASPVKESK